MKVAVFSAGKIGYLGLDVCEEEEQIFFEDRSGLIIPYDVFARLLTFPNVLITGHQAFLHAGSIGKHRSHYHRQHYQIPIWRNAGQSPRSLRGAFPSFRLDLGMTFLL